MRLLCVLFVVVVQALAGSSAHAERADRQKPIHVESDRMTADDAKQVAVFEGKVVLTQGTFQLRADRLTVRQDKEGHAYAVAVGRPATFREKRDGVDEWIDGEAERIEYDGRMERVELFTNARLTREKDEVRGNFISWDGRTEMFLVQESKQAPRTAGSPGGRVRATLQPKQKPATPEAPQGGLDLKPSSSLAAP